MNLAYFLILFAFVNVSCKTRPKPSDYKIKTVESSRDDLPAETPKPSDDGNVKTPGDGKVKAPGDGGMKAPENQLNIKIGSCVIKENNIETSCLELNFEKTSGEEISKAKAGCAIPAGKTTNSVFTFEEIGCSAKAKTMNACVYPAQAGEVAATLYSDDNEQFCTEQGGSFTPGSNP
ncbi:MAG: hypothetical protein NTX25_19680 [Proteobacteria bacterium]|nr:hypothetical protein [Pseudomonadota bacterium]